MTTYEEIKQSIKDSKRLIFWYDSKGKLLIVDSSKSASRKKLLKTKYEGETYRLAITFHTGTHFGQGGQLAVHCRKFIIEDNKIIKVKGDSNGIIWFEKDWLKTNREWDEVLLDIIVRKLIRGFNFGIGIYVYPI